MLPYQNHVPHAPSRLNPSFPSSSFQIPSPLPSTISPAPMPRPFPSPPIIIGGGRFGKRKLSIAQTQGMGRGTMSMPTSPLGQSVNTEVWQGVSPILTIVEVMRSLYSLIRLLLIRVNLYVPSHDSAWLIEERLIPA